MDLQNLQAENVELRARLAELEKTIADQQRRMPYLRAMEDLNRAVLVENQLVTLLIDPASGSILDASPAALEYYGYDLSRIRSMKISEINTLPQDQIGEEMARAASEQRAFFNFRHRLANGEIREVEVYSRPVSVDGHSLLYSIVRDVSERRQMEAALRESEERYRMQLENLPVPAYAWQWREDDFVMVDSNEAARDFTSGGINLLIGKTALTIYGENSTVRSDLLKCFRTHEIVRRSERTFVVSIGEYRELDTTYYYIAPDLVIGNSEDITGRKRDEEKLAYQALLLENISDAIVASDNDYRITYWNAAAEEMYGWKAQEVLGQMGVNFTQTQFGEADKDEMMAAIARQGFWHGEATQARKDGRRFPVDLSSLVIRNQEGQVTGYVSVNRDISERKKIETELRQSEQKHRVLFENQIFAIVISDQKTRHILDANDAFLHLYGFQREELPGLTVRDVSAEVEETIQSLDRSVQKQDTEFVPLRYHKKKDGAIFPVEIVFGPFVWGNRPVIFSMVHDISDRINAENSLQLAHDQLTVQMVELQSLQEELREQAVRDPLTGLYNRRYLSETLPREISRVEREGESLSVIVADIDHFKKVNDSYGHQAGDKVLVRVSEIFQQCTRASDLACRYGGEEFLLALPGASETVAQERAEELRRLCFESVIESQDQKLNFSMSLGVAAYPMHGASAEEIIIKADQAMYISKALGRNRVTVWKY